MSSVENVPVLGISYLPKVKEVLNDLGYKNCYIVDGYPQFPDFNDMKKAFDKVWNNRQGIKGIVEERVRLLQTKYLESVKLINNISPSSVSLIKLALVSCFFVMAMVMLGFLQIYRSRISRFEKNFQKRL